MFFECISWLCQVNATVNQAPVNKCLQFSIRKHFKNMVIGLSLQNLHIWVLSVDLAIQYA